MVSLKGSAECILGDILSIHTTLDPKSSNPRPCLCKPLSRILGICFATYLPRSRFRVLGVAHTNILRPSKRNFRASSKTKC